jgi:hypothetical protein
MADLFISSVNTLTLGLSSGPTFTGFDATSNVTISGSTNSTNSQTILDIQAGSTPLSLTLAGFSSNSNATFVGLNPIDFTLQLSDGTSLLGPALMLQVLPVSGAKGAPTTITLPGYSAADLTNGHLFVEFGTDAATDLPALNIRGN